MAHAPVRTCVGCGRRRPAADLARLGIVDGPHGPIAAVGRRVPGRGAWVCGADCVAAARRRRGFQRAWRRDVPEHVVEQVAQLLAD